MAQVNYQRPKFVTRLAEPISGNRRLFEHRSDHGGFFCLAITLVAAAIF
jgi:hypothetical protein